jgi:hypothetical protein
MWGQLCLGKSDFDALENVRLDRYFREAQGIKQMPSASRLCQGFDEDARASSSSAWATRRWSSFAIQEHW